MRRISIKHNTHYHYTDTVRFLAHKLYLRPRSGHDIRIESSSLDIVPSYSIEWQRDLFGNSVAIATFNQEGSELRIDSDVIVQHFAAQQPALELADHARQYPFKYDPIELANLAPYQAPIYAEDATIIRDWLQDFLSGSPPSGTAELLTRINRQIAETIGYMVRDEPGVQSPALTLQTARGSCRDVATLFIEACRHYGLGSRFVSGYLVSEAAVQDFSTTHAWSEIYLPGAGWLGFDSTSGQLVGADHIAVAVHRHPEAIPPVSGTFISPSNVAPTMDVHVHVEIL